MITRGELEERASILGLAPHVVEKDYVLGWVIHGIFSNEELTISWVFKGGTCLKKCYFETYRFSEDLDFTVMEEQQLDEKFLTRVMTDVANWVYEHSGIEIPTDRLRFDVIQNPRGGTSCEARLYYQGPLPTGGKQNLPRIKFDLLTDETVCADPVRMRVTHEYSDEMEDGFWAQCYSFEEIYAEKLRALCDRSRARDLYDVVHLYRHKEHRPNAEILVEIIKIKFDSRDIPTPRVEFLQDNAIRQELEATWTAMLQHQLTFLPPFESFWSELPEIFSWIESGAQQTVPEEVPFWESEEKITRSEAIAEIAGSGTGLPMPSVPGQQFGSYLELLRFAGANRLCVDLHYQGSTRLIEPYSLRRTRAGNIVLHSLRHTSGEHRSYRLDRIQGAMLTDETFRPVYDIELTESGIQPIPQTSRISTRRTGIRRARTSGTYGPTYIVQCSVCGRQFNHRTRSSSLNRHKNTGGWVCSGRRGFVVGIR